MRYMRILFISVSTLNVCTNKLYVPLDKRHVDLSIGPFTLGTQNEREQDAERHCLVLSHARDNDNVSIDKFVYYLSKGGHAAKPKSWPSDYAYHHLQPTPTFP